jgi:hypothetical protein
VFAEDTAEKKTPYTIEYSKVEQTVLGNNLQVNSNMLERVCKPKGCSESA